ncbi:MAG: hypothetical protein AAF399_02020 [Bacteroidota bacterium]
MRSGNIDEAHHNKVIRPLLPLFIGMLVALILTTYVPALSLWLPGVFGML